MTAKVAVHSRKKAKKYVEHSQDSLELARAIANSQEEKIQRKTERLHQSQPGQPKPHAQLKKNNTARRGDKLTKAKATIVKHQAHLKKEKVKRRKERAGDDQSQSAHRATGAAAPPVGSEATGSNEKKPPRKKVSFA